jgi:hypothetical protein
LIIWWLQAAVVHREQVALAAQAAVVQVGCDQPLRQQAAAEV